MKPPTRRPSYLRSIIPERLQFWLTPAGMSYAAVEWPIRCGLALGTLDILASLVILLGIRVKGDLLIGLCVTSYVLNIGGMVLVSRTTRWWRRRKG